MTWSAKWVGTRVPLADKGMMRYLRIHWDMLYSGEAILDMAWEKLDIALARIQTFSCTNNIKKTALERCVYMSLVYQLKFANWSLITFRTLDQKISACIKRILGLYQSYPTDLLYLPGKYGGHGWLRLSDVVHIAKLSLLNRYHAPKGGPDPQSLNGLHPRTISSLIGRSVWAELWFPRVNMSN